MRILITNDDGVWAAGIRHLVEVAAKFSNDIIVVAPTHSYSGMSHSITMSAPLFVDKLEEKPGLTIYSCTGSPVDCIKIAMDELLVDTPPDLILSGINHGSNANISIIYSGTMGAATEGAFYGIPSIGLSYVDHDEMANMDTAVEWAERAIALYLAEPRGVCWNVNIPVVPSGQVKGIRFCRQTRGVWREEFVKRTDPRGREYYWMSGRFYNAEPEAKDTDEWCLKEGYVTVVPVQTDLTDYEALNREVPTGTR